MTQYGFYFDQQRCNNCHACVVSCRDWYDIQPGPVKWVRILQEEMSAWPQPRINLVFAPCYHCENPVCIDACEPHALFKEDKYGAVLVDEDLCTGCRDCWVACPYGAPQFEDDAPGTVMSKCTMCYDELERGNIPVCVAACPGRALDFGPLEELQEKYGTLRALPDMPSGDVEKPAVVFTELHGQEELVPYDVDKVLEINKVRGDAKELPLVYSDTREVTETWDGLVGYDKLVMKSPSVGEALERSKNELG